jgi:hypothetical protein
MYGFPGETVDSMAATRRMIRTINDGHETSPVVQMASMAVADIQDFAGLSQRDGLKNVARRFDYDRLEVSSGRAAEEKLVSCMEMARISHAPATGFGSSGALWSLFDNRYSERDTRAFFRWMKALDRMMGIFAEQEVDGRKPRMAELTGLRREVLARVDPRYRQQRRLSLLGMQVRHRLSWFALDHWSKHGAEVDLLTRSAIAWEVAHSTGRLRDAGNAFRAGRLPPLGIVAGSETEISASRLSDLGVATGRRKLARFDRTTPAADVERKQRLRP